MKYLLTFFLFFLTSVSIGFAQTEFPAGLMHEPKTFSPGTTVTFTALVYNNSKTSVTYEIVLTNQEKPIGKKLITVPALTAKPALFPWKATEGSHLFKATINKATNAQGKPVPITQPFTEESFTVTTEGLAETRQPASDAVNTVKEKATQWLGYVDAWRQKERAKAVTKRDYWKKEMDAPLVHPAAENLNQPERADGKSLPALPKMSGSQKPMTYISYFWFLLLSNLFSSGALFYGVSIVVVFLLLRFIWTRFV